MLGKLLKLLYFCGVQEQIVAFEGNKTFFETFCPNACIYENYFVPLHYLIKQTSINLLILSVMKNFETSNVVVVNGVAMDINAYRKAMKVKRGITPKKRKHTPTDIQLLDSDIKAMLKSIKLIKSLSAYYDNAYRQWGRVAKDIINYAPINAPFVSYRNKVREMNKTLQDIEQISAKSEKAVFQYIRKLSYQLDDIRETMDKLFANIGKSGLVQRHKDHECINGEGKRLGLRVLMGRSWGAMREMNIIIKRCQNISDEGLDAFDYTQETYNGLLNMWSKKN